MNLDVKDGEMEESASTVAAIAEEVNEKNVIITAGTNHQNAPKITKEMLQVEAEKFLKSVEYFYNGDCKLEGEGGTSVVLSHVFHSLQSMTNLLNAFIPTADGQNTRRVPSTDENSTSSSVAIGSKRRRRAEVLTDFWPDSSEDDEQLQLLAQFASDAAATARSQSQRDNTQSKMPSFLWHTNKSLGWRCPATREDMTRPMRNVNPSLSCTHYIDEACFDRLFSFRMICDCPVSSCKGKWMRDFTASVTPLPETMPCQIFTYHSPFKSWVLKTEGKLSIDWEEERVLIEYSRTVQPEETDQIVDQPNRYYLFELILMPDIKLMEKTIDQVSYLVLKTEIRQLLPRLSTSATNAGNNNKPCYYAFNMFSMENMKSLKQVLSDLIARRK